MDNYPPPMFHFSSSSSFSSSTLPQNSHHNSSILNMVMNSHHAQQDHMDQLIQDDQHNGYMARITTMENNNNNNILGNYSTLATTTTAEAMANTPAADGTENEAKPGKRKGEKKSRKQPRYAFQTRSQVDILDDGYRWRKYGQKAVKNNKFPRSYYRCTHQGCNVKKQVQRLSRDEGMVVTTYEGMHSHAIQKSTDNFEHILSQMQIYTNF